jgi:hypothetical protein
MAPRPPWRGPVMSRIRSSKHTRAAACDAGAAVLVGAAAFVYRFLAHNSFSNDQYIHLSRAQAWLVANGQSAPERVDGRTWRYRVDRRQHDVLRVLMRSADVALEDESIWARIRRLVKLTDFAAGPGTFPILLAWVVAELVVTGRKSARLAAHGAVVMLIVIAIDIIVVGNAREIVARTGVLDGPAAVSAQANATTPPARGSETALSAYLAREYRVIDSRGWSRDARSACTSIGIALRKARRSFRMAVFRSVVARLILAAARQAPLAPGGHRARRGHVEAEQPSQRGIRCIVRRQRIGERDLLGDDRH